MKPINNDKGIMAAKKIEIVKEELNPIFKNNTRKKLCISVTSPSSLERLPSLKQLDDRLLINFLVENPLDSEAVDESSLIDDLEKFRRDFRVILERSTKIRLIETKKKKPILLIFSPFSNLGLEDKCMVLASENKDLEDFIDILVLIGYSKLEITS